MMRRIKIAAVSYLNTIPFIYGMEHGGFDLRADLLLSPPRDCARLFSEHIADIALIPVAAVPALEDVQIVTDFCIGAVRPVRSVILASNTPLGQIESVYMDSHSLTSIRLARVLAARWWHITPRWLPLDDFAILNDVPEKSAFILIGDKVFDHESKFSYIYDLAEAWQQMTALPFAFAVWVARNDVATEFLQTLNAALGFGVGHIDCAIEKYGYGNRDYAHDYLTRNIDFLFDAQKRKALQLFWDEGMKVEPLLNPG